MKRIGFFFRLLAALIDLAFLFLLYITFAVAWVFLQPIGVTERAMQIAMLLAVLLYTMTEIFFAGTPGKLLLRLRIVGADETSADRWRLFVRWSAKQSHLVFQFLFVTTNSPGFRMLGGFSGLVVLIGCLYAANDDKRAWHDQWAGTAVVTKPPKREGFPVVLSRDN